MNQLHMAGRGGRRHADARGAFLRIDRRSMNWTDAGSA